MARTSIALEPLGPETELRRSAFLLVRSAAWNGIIGAVSSLAAWYARRRQIDRTVDALSGLSDHALKDIGIHRSEIRSIAHSRRDTTYDRT